MGKKLVKGRIEDNDAAIGIGTLIVFIAMVLVAGIAASVLVQTSTTLEMQALKTGSQTVDQVASGIQIEGIEGWNNHGERANPTIQRLAIEIKSRAGSPDVDLSTTVIEISDSDNKYVLNFNESCYTNETSVNGSVLNADYYPTYNDTTEFGLIVLQDADGSCTSDNPVINFGDHVILAVADPFDGIQPRTDMFGQVISEEGAPGIIGFRTSESYTCNVLELQ